MATLHVRNVPDGLYEKLRARAERNGRSIGAETVVLLEAQLVVLPFHTGPRRTRRVLATASARFEPYGRATVAAAQEEARALGHEAVATEHLLLALLQLKVGVGALAATGLDYAEARAQVERIRGRGEALPAEALPLDGGAKTALELALRESLDAGSAIITHEDLLLGVVREEDGLGARLVAARGLDPEELRVRAHRPSRHAGGPTTGGVVFELRRPFRVVELEGTAEQWEEKLNDVSAAGYELVEVVGGRAIFQAAGTTASIAARRLLT